MESEYQVLNHLHENEITTQRNISKRTGLSLGAVNILIKKMVRKGLVKVEKLNSRTMRYILTPRGLQEKASLTYSYMRQSYRQLIRIHQALDDLIAERASAINGQPIILYGPADEIREILIQHLDEQTIACEFYSEPDLRKQAHLLAARLVLTWREEEETALNGNARTVNIMKLV